MEIFLLVILFTLLFLRVKSTPSALSKSLYIKKMQKAINKRKSSNNSEESDKVLQGAAILIIWLLEIFLVIFYIVLGNKLGTTYLIVLSALQIITCIYSGAMSSKMLSLNIDEYKFKRLYFLFNVIIDYMYYPVAIYLLLK